MQLGTYKHYKGKLYQVIGTAFHTETRETLVLYKPLYEVDDLPELGKHPIFARPKTMFQENVIVENQTQPRFQLLDEDNEQEH